MKLFEILRYELEYRLRSPSTWLYAAVLFGISFMMIAGGNDGDGPLNINAPAELANFTLGLSAFAMVITAALFGDAAVRDPATGMDPLVYTTSVRKLEYLGGRYLAALVTNASVLLAIPLGLAAAMVLPPDGPLEYGPFRVAAYAQPFLLLVLPNLLFSSAVMFAIGMLSRSVIPVYLGGIALMICYGLVGNYLMNPQNPLVAVVADPLGINTLSRMTQYWTAAERNARTIGFPVGMLWNRLAWIALACVVLTVLHRVFRFARPDGRAGRRRDRVTDESELAHAPPVMVPRVTGSFGSGTALRQILSVARNALTELIATRSFFLILSGTVALTMLWGWNAGSTTFETTIWPATFLIAEEVLSLRVLPVIYMLIALYAGELVWKEREAGVAEIADAAPVPEAVALAGRFVALVAMLALIQAAIMVGGMMIQAFHGYYHFEPGLYLRIVFGVNLTSFILLAALAMTVHVAVDNKYAGHFIVMLILIGLQAADRTGLVRHYLLLYARSPDWTYSDMNGFGPFVEPIVWFKLYWTAWAILLGVAACLLWVRGRESGMRRRLGEARRRLTVPAIRTAGMAVVLIVLFGGFIFYNTNVLNDYTPPEDRGAVQARLENRYSRFADAAQPTIEAAALRVEIYPDDQAVDLKGSFRLVNRTVVAIDTIHVYVDPDLDTRVISFDRSAAPVIADARVGFRSYRLAQSLQPGDSMELRFDIGYRQDGFPNNDIPTSVAGNGAYFDRRWMPFVGYQPMFEIRDPAARKELGLAPQKPLPAPADRGSRRYRQPFRDADLVHVDMVIGTSADQVASTPGTLRKEWTENDRRYFHYVTEAPSSFGATVFSGRYAVVEDRWNDVALTVFHHPGHTRNLDTFTRAMKAALEYCTDAFGPYQYSQLRVVEVPRYGFFGRAHPYIIGFTEETFITRSTPDQFDQVFFGTAHEVAHSWWGGQVRSAQEVSGGQAFVSEALANYTAMMVTEKTFGRDAARTVYDYQMNRYLSRRATQGQDVPLLESFDQAWISYGKGAVALYTLREMIGEDRVTTALRTFIRKNSAGVPPFPTSYDLFAELRAVTPDSMQYLLTDLFETVTLWDVKAERVSVVPTGSGAYRVTLDVVARKLRADGNGNETEVPMNDFVDIGVFAEGDGTEPGDALYLKMHRIRSGRQQVVVTVPRLPARAGVDPHHRLIDRFRDDNVTAVEPAGAAPGRAGQ